MTTVQGQRSVRFGVPGSEETLLYEYDDAGALVRLTGAGRTYLDASEGRRNFDSGFVEMLELQTAAGLLRQVRSGGDAWTETYLVDAAGRPTSVDGVEIQRDDQGRVTACLGPEACWRYVYHDDHLTRIETPGGARRIQRDDLGRPTTVEEPLKSRPIRFDADGRRRGVPAVPETCQRDDLGRLWTVCDRDGRILTTFIWDGFACLGRIDGALGEPLAAVFSLDHSGTPVRVITRGGVERIARDAFGESLLGRDGVPGLFGGAAHGGFFHYRSRALDPLTGSYDAPDPFDGSENDPRRSLPSLLAEDGEAAPEGLDFGGPLIVERSPAGPYAVCQNDPIGFIDPTGEISFGFLVSTLTWALQNNFTGWVGLYFTINLWGCLFTGNLDRLGRWKHISSDRFNIGGFNLDGVLNGDTGAWTMQHIIWARGEYMDGLKDVFVFDPKGEFKPTLYSSMLRIVPSDGSAPLLIRGTRILGGVPTGSLPTDWARVGGPGVSVVPDSPVPHFPNGGLHFGGALRASQPGRPGLRGPQSATLTETEPSGAFGTGTIQQRPVLVAPAGGLGLNPDDLVLISDTTTANVDIVRVLSAAEAGGRTRIRLDVTALTSGGQRLRRLTQPPLSNNNLNSGPAIDSASADSLSTAGSAGDYVAGDPLRLSQGGAQVGAATIKRLESRVSIDAALPAMTSPLRVFAATVGAVAEAATLPSDTTINFTGATVPGQGALIVVNNAGGTLAVVITGPGSGTERPVDRSLAALRAASADVQWRPITRGGAPLGTRADAVEPGTDLTYVPQAVRTAPAAGFVAVEDSAATPVSAVRAVTAAVYDVLVLGTNLAGNTANQYAVERFAFTAPDQAGLTLETETVLGLNPNVPLAGVALQLHQLNGTATAAGANALTGSTLAGAVATGGAVLAGTQVTPSQFVVLSRAGNLAGAVVKEVRETYRLDRVLPLGAPALEVVRLQNGGPAYAARQLGPLQLDLSTVAAPPAIAVGDVVNIAWPATTNQYRVSGVEGATLRLENGAAQTVAVAVGAVNVNPTVVQPVTVTALPQVGATRVEMPQFGQGELVEVVQTAVAARPFTVTAVAGTVITVVLQTDPLAHLVEPTAMRLVPGDPRTGGTRDGLAGAPIAGTPTDIRLRVWQLNTLPANTRVAIVDGNVTRPARAVSVQNREVEFHTAPVLGGAGNINITAPAISSAFAPRFTQEGAAIVIPDAVTGITLPSPNLVVAIPHQETARVANGELNPGTVLVPEDPENWEHNRQQALIEHELRHTQQYLWLGPLFFTMFPLWALDVGIAARTNAELPTFSPFVAAQMVRDESDESQWLQISNPQGFAENAMVQVSQGSLLAVTRLGPVRNTNQFRLRDVLGLTQQPVFVRRRNDDPNAWYVKLEKVARALTPATLMNASIALTYGTMYQLIRRLFLLGSALFGRDAQYEATIEDEGRGIRLKNAEQRTKFFDVERITIESSSATIVRSVLAPGPRGPEGVMRLSQPSTVQGEVKIQPFSQKSPRALWDTRNYFPAELVEGQRTSLRVLPVGSDRLSLAAFDRVMVLSDSEQSRGLWPWPYSTWSSKITAVNGDVVELEDPPPLPEGELPRGAVFRVSKIGSEEPFGSLDSRLLDDWAGLGWVRWVTDPFSQLQVRTQSRRGSFLDILYRSMRYLLGTSGWSLLLPGVYFFDNFFLRGFQYDPHLSWMEQDASEESGELYTPIGRLRGQITSNGFASAKTMVGDIFRYWYFPEQSLESIASMAGTPQDAPGIHITPEPRVLPLVTAEVAGGAAPNNGAAAPAVAQEPGLAVSDVFTTKVFADPRDTATNNPRSFIASNRGWIPTGPLVDRTYGIYVSFTRPGTHRVSVRDGVSDSADGREAHDKEKQRLFYKVEVADVAVKIAGRSVARGDTIRLLQLQQVEVDVQPVDERRYIATLLQPQNGIVLRGVPSREKAIAAQRRNGTETVQIDRVYRFDATARTFDSGGLVQHGMHTPSDVRVSVREFSIEVVNVLPVLAPLPTDLTTDPYTVAAATLRSGGEVFILVCAPVVSFALTNPGTGNPVAADATPPEADNPVRLFVGAPNGAVFRVSLDVNDPPEEPVNLTFNANVGTPGDNVPVSATFPLTPHFRLTSPTGSFDAARNADFFLNTTDNVTVGQGGVTVIPPAGVTVTNVSGFQITLRIDAAAAVGPRRVLVQKFGEPNVKGARTINIV